MFSYFLPPITNTRPALSVTLEEVYEMIISEKWAQTTRSLRSLRKGEQADFKRRQLPFVTFSGIFSARHSEHIVRHSGLMCFDFDHVGNATQIRELQRRLVEDSTLRVRLVFQSPSGDGLKLVVDANEFLSSMENNKTNSLNWNYNAIYLRIKSYIEQKYNVKADKTNDIARACFLCHDPKAYIRQSKVYGQQSTEESRRDNRPQAEFKFNPYKNNYRQELEFHRNNITQAGVSTPVHKSPTQPKPRRGDRENSVGVTSVEIQRALLTKSNSESLNPNGKKSFKSVQSVGENSNPDGTRSVNQRSLSLWRKNSVGSVDSVRDKKNSVKDKEISVRDKKISVRDKENAEASPASKSVESVERFSRSERANKSSPPVLGGKLQVSEVKLSLLKLYRARAISTELIPEGGGGLLSVSSVQSVGNINSAWHAERNSVGSVDSVRDKKNSVRNKNSEGVKSVQICRAPSCEAKSEFCAKREYKPNLFGLCRVKTKSRAKRVIEEKEELKSELSVQSVGDKIAGEATASSVFSVSSVRNKNSSVRDKKNSVKDKEISVRDKTSVEEKTLEMALRRIELHHIDVTTHYHDWYRIGMALASHYGEAGRDYYHRISRFYPRYTPLETNQQYDRCLRYNTHRIRLGTLFYLLNI